MFFLITKPITHGLLELLIRIKNLKLEISNFFFGIQILTCGQSKVSFAKKTRILLKKHKLTLMRFFMHFGAKLAGILLLSNSYFSQYELLNRRQTIISVNTAIKLRFVDSNTDQLAQIRLMFLLFWLILAFYATPRARWKTINSEPLAPVVRTGATKS